MDRLYAGRQGLLFHIAANHSARTYIYEKLFFSVFGTTCLFSCPGLVTTATFSKILFSKCLSSLAHSLSLWSTKTALRLYHKYFCSLGLNDPYCGDGPVKTITQIWSLVRCCGILVPLRHISQYSIHKSQSSMISTDTCQQCFRTMTDILLIIFSRVGWRDGCWKFLPDNSKAPLVPNMC